MVAKQEKTTITLPHDLKQRALELKTRLETSLNSLIKKAVEEYIKKEEAERWIKGAEKASKNTSYKKEALEMDVGGQFYEY